MRTLKRKLNGVIGVVATLGGVSITIPQTEAAVLEEVVVTARKRQESLQDVPVAIQVLSGEKIMLFDSSNMEEVVDAVNNVDVIPGSSGAGGGFRVRGIAASSSDAGIESSVTVNIDGVQTGRGHISRLPMFDLQSVQVLKGPQALYFGKDSPAGVIAVTSATPTDEFSAGITVGYESEAHEELIDGFISGPLSETVSARLAVRLSSHDGWLDNQARFIENSNGQFIPTEPYDFRGALTDPGAEDNYSARLTVDWDITENLAAILRLTANNINSDGFATVEVANCGALGPAVAELGLPAPGFIIDPAEDCKLNRKLSHAPLPAEIADSWSPGPMLRMSGDGAPFATLDTWIGSLNLEWQHEWGVINAVSGYYAYEYRALDNFGSLGFGNNYIGFHPEDHEQWTQEVRVLTQFDGPLNLMAGVYYETFERDRTTSTKIAALGPDPITGYSNSATVIQLTEGDVWSAFAELTWSISDDWELSAGARYTRDEKEGMQFSNYVHTLLVLSGAFLPAFTEIAADFDDDQVSPEVTLTWRPARDYTFWAAYKTGYKGGGFSAPGILTSNFTSESIVFAPEEADGFEFGVKALLLDQRLRVNATAYHYEFDDLQVTALDTVTTSFTIDNAASSTTYGVEADIEYLQSENLLLRAEFGYNKAEYDDFPGANCYRSQPVGPDQCVDLNGDGLGDVQNLGGEPWPNAPEWAGSLGFEYRRPLTGSWNLMVAAEAIYTGDFVTAADLLPQAEQTSMWRVNARAGLERADGRWSIAVVGRNVTDEEGIVGGTKPGAATPVDQTGVPFRKELMLQASFRL